MLLSEKMRQWQEVGERDAYDGGFYGAAFAQLHAAISLAIPEVKHLEDALKDVEILGREMFKDGEKGYQFVILATRLRDD